MIKSVKQNLYERLTKKILTQAQVEQCAGNLESFFKVLMQIDRKQQKSNEKQDN